MSYGVNSIQIHKKLRLDKRAGSDNWYARLTLPNGKRLVKTTKTEDIESAKEVALRLYYEVDARIQNKLPATIPSAFKRVMTGSVRAASYCGRMRSAASITVTFDPSLAMAVPISSPI